MEDEKGVVIFDMKVILTDEQIVLTNKIENKKKKWLQSNSSEQ